MAELSAEVRARLDEALERHGLNRSAGEVLKAVADADEDKELTAREVEVLWAVACGGQNGEIAKRLLLSVETVKSHIRNILGKTGTFNRAHAVAWAYEHRVFEPSDDV